MCARACVEGGMRDKLIWGWNGLQDLSARVCLNACKICAFVQVYMIPYQYIQYPGLVRPMPVNLRAQRGNQGVCDFPRRPLHEYPQSPPLPTCGPSPFDYSLWSALVILPQGFACMSCFLLGIGSSRPGCLFETKESVSVQMSPTSLICIMLDC